MPEVLRLKDIRQGPNARPLPRLVPLLLRQQPPPHDPFGPIVTDNGQMSLYLVYDVAGP